MPLYAAQNFDACGDTLLLLPTIIALSTSKGDHPAQARVSGVAVLMWFVGPAYMQRDGQAEIEREGALFSFSLPRFLGGLL